MKLKLRQTKLYQEMTVFKAVDLIEISGGRQAHVAVAWQWLHDTKHAYRLQGWYGRTAQDLLSNGRIEE